MDNIRTSWIGVVVYPSPKHQTAEGIGGTSTRLPSFQWAFLILLTPIKRALKSPGGFLFPETPGVLGLMSILMTPPEIRPPKPPPTFVQPSLRTTAKTDAPFRRKNNQRDLDATQKPTRSPQPTLPTLPTRLPPQKRKKTRATDATSTHLPPTRPDEKTDAAMDAARAAHRARPC